MNENDTTHPDPGSVDDEQLRADLRRRTMRFGVVGDLIAHSRFQRERATVFQLGVQLPFDAEKDVTLGAPMIGEVARRVFDDPYADVPESERAPVGAATFTSMFGWLNGRP